MTETGHKAPHMDCAVCARPLTFVEPTNIYVHSVSRDHDHVAVPVPPGTVQTKYRCDFCSVDIALEHAWTVPVQANAFNIPGYTFSDDGWWCACPGCVPYVQKRDWKGLVRRVTRVGIIDTKPAIVRINMLRMFKNVGANMTGDPYPEIP